MEAYLKKIVENTGLKASFYVVLSGKNSKIETTFTPPLDFAAGCKFEIA